MKQILYAAIAVGALCSMSACGKKAQTQSESEEPAPKYLVLYYSQEGNTRRVAEELQKHLNADIEAIELEDPYPADYDQTIARCRQERADSVTPAIKPLKSDINSYDVVFLGYPVWFGTYALPIATLLKEQKFEGKTVVPFCTFGSGGLESSTADLRAALPNATVADGYGVRSARLAAMPREVNRFLIEREYIDGEVTALPGYSEQQPVTDEEKAIFDAACSGYRFPLGTPVTAGRRGTDEGVDFEFVVNATDFNGNPVTATIYVTVPNGNNAQPEFTRVVR